MKTTCILGFLFMLIAISPNVVEAKLLPQTKLGSAPASKNISSVQSITVFPRLRTDRQALLVTFGNLQNANTVSYTLQYATNGQQEGAIGTITLTGLRTAERELLFGTCSKNICRYHTRISNMKFEVTAELKSGKKVIKRYRVRI